MSAFYAPLRGLQSAIDQIIMLDSQMVELRRVMDAAPQTYNRLMEDSINLSSELGNKIEDVNRAMIEFSRQGYSPDVLMDLTKTATIAANISELQTDEAMSSLTAGMKSFGIEAKNSMSIIDRLNEVDNNFAIDTKNLSEAMMKSAATANTFGVSIDELLGYISAIGITTRESGRIVGNSLKTIFSRITTMKPAVDGLKSVGISIKDTGGQMRDVSDILGDLAGQWDTLNAEQQQNLGVTLAGRFQVSRFLTLMQQWDTSMKVTEASINSQGSAMAEQEEYAKSLQSRLNRLSNAGVSLSQTLGEAFLTDGMVFFAEFIIDLANNYDGLVKSVGFLAPALGAAGLAVGAFSGRMRSMASSIIFAENAEKRMIATTAVLKTTLRGLMAVTGIGLVFAGVGFAIEKVIGLIGNNIKKQEELQAASQQAIKSMQTEKENINGLVEEYEKLANTDRNNKQEARYVELQNELARLLPTIKVGTDEKGNAIIANTSAIKDNIGVLEEQLRLENQLASLEAPDTISSNEDTIEENRKEVDRLKEELDSAMADYQDQMLNGNKHDQLVSGARVDDLTSQLRTLREETNTLVYESQQAYASLLRTVEGLSNADIQWLSNLAIDEKLDPANVEKYAKKVANLRNELGKGFSFKGVNTSQLDVIDEVAQSAKAAGDSVSEWSNFSSTLQEAGVTSENVSQILGGLRNSEEDVAQAANNANVETKNAIPTFDALGQIVGWSAQKFDEEGNAIDEDTDAKLSNVQASEILFGVTADQITQAQNAIRIINTLSQVENLNERQKMLLAQATGVLSEMYPGLSGNIMQNIGAISTEITAMADLNAASAENAGVMMGNQDAVTRSAIGASNQRIIALQNEAKALQDIVDAYVKTQIETEGVVASNGYINDLIRNRIPNVQGELSTAQSARQEIIYGNLIPQDYTSDIPNSPRYSGGGSSGSSGGSGGSGSSSNKAAKKAEEAQKRVLEVIQQQIEAYNRKSDALNDNIALEEYYLSKYDETSKQYRQRQSNIAELKKQQANYHKDSIQYIKDQLQNNSRLNKAQRRELKKTLSETKETYYSVLGEIDSINKEIKSSYESIADELVEVYKQAYEKQKEIALDANENELKILEDAHDKKIKMLDEEMSAYEELINAKIESMDKEKENADYAEELADKQQKRMEIQRQIQTYSLDDSMSARSKVQELQEQLREQEEEIADFTSNRQREQRKESLQDQLENKREQIESERELENMSFEQQQKQLEKDKQNIEQHYEDLLNNERQFARMREQILNGNVSSMTNAIKKFADDIHDNMEVVGRSISHNLIDRISDARKLLQGINMGYSSITSSTQTPSNPSSFASGGFTGKFSGGKLAMLHEKELVLNQRDTSNMLNAVSLVRNIANKIPKMNTVNNKNDQSISFSPTFKYYVQGQFDENLAKQYSDYTMKEMNNGLQGLGVQFPR